MPRPATNVAMQLALNGFRRHCVTRPGCLGPMKAGIGHAAKAVTEYRSQRASSYDLASPRGKPANRPIVGQ